MEILYKIAGVMFSLSIISFSIVFMIFCFQSTIDEYKEAKNKTTYWLVVYVTLLISGILIFFATVGIKGIV
ncbi:hypothetical protein [Leptotrichia buccalis]